MSEKFNAIVKVKVIGIGGGGSNSVESMIDSGIVGVEFIIINTDIQALEKSNAPIKLNIGKKLRKGLGAGADPLLGEKAAIESEDLIREHIEGCDMVIISVGMGGGTGTGASPIIAKIAKEMGALVVALLTTPFGFEGPSRTKNALQGIEKLKKEVDSFIIISNQKLFESYGDVPISDSFKFANTVLKQTVRTITDIIALPAEINLDFADVKAIIENQGEALIGIGRASGKDRAIKAATHAISSPILAAPIKGADRAIINISGANVSLSEIDKAVSIIRKSSNNSDLNNIFGFYSNPSFGEEIYVSVIATGINSSYNENISQKQINKEALEIVQTTEIEYEDQKTKEILVANLQKENNDIYNNLDFSGKITTQKESYEDELPTFLKGSN